MSSDNRGIVSNLVATHGVEYVLRLAADALVEDADDDVEITAATARALRRNAQRIRSLAKSIAKSSP